MYGDYNYSTSGVCRTVRYVFSQLTTLTVCVCLGVAPAPAVQHTYPRADDALPNHLMISGRPSTHFISNKQTAAPCYQQPSFCTHHLITSHGSTADLLSVSSVFTTIKYNSSIVDILAFHGCTVHYGVNIGKARDYRNCHVVGFCMA